MRLKISKQELLNTIYSDLYSSEYIPDLSQYPPSQWKSMIKRVIDLEVKFNVHRAMETLLDNIYTEEEFESDIGLNR